MLLAEMQVSNVIMVIVIKEFVIALFVIANNVNTSK